MSRRPASPDTMLQLDFGSPNATVAGPLEDQTGRFACQSNLIQSRSGRYARMLPRSRSCLRTASLCWSQAWRIVRDVARRAGIERSVSPHFMRHSHATHAIERGVKLTTVRDTLRHSSLAATKPDPRLERPRDRPPLRFARVRQRGPSEDSAATIRPGSLRFVRGRRAPHRVRNRTERRDSRRGRRRSPNRFRRGRIRRWRPLRS